MAHDTKVNADALAAMLPHGLRVRAADVLDQLGFEPPGEDDEVLGGSPAGSLTKAKAKAKAPANDPLIAVIDAINGGAWQALAAPLIEPILRRAAADPDGLPDAIAEAYPEMDSEALTEQLARILFVADVAGREVAT